MRIVILSEVARVRQLHFTAMANVSVLLLDPASPYNYAVINAQKTVGVTLEQPLLRLYSVLMKYLVSHLMPFDGANPNSVVIFDNCAMPF